MKLSFSTCMGFLYLGAWLLSSGFSHAQDISEIHVSRGKTLDHGLKCFDKDVVIDGRVLGNLFCFGGHTTISGEVSGTVTVFFGHIEIVEGAQIKGRIISVGSPYIGAPLPLDKFIQISVKDVFYPYQFSFFEQVKRSLARILFGFLLVSILLFFKPNLVREAGLEIRTDWMPVFFAGTFLLLFFTGSMAGTLLIFSQPVGPVLFIGFTIVIGVVSLFGLVAVVEALASTLIRLFNFKGSYIHALMMAVVLLEIACILPWVGQLLQLIVLILGFGSTLLTRFGTNRGWFTKKKNVWPGAI